MTPRVSDERLRAILAEAETTEPGPGPHIVGGVWMYFPSYSTLARDLVDLRASSAARDDAVRALVAAPREAKSQAHALASHIVEDPLNKLTSTQQKFIGDHIVGVIWKVLDELDEQAAKVGALVGDALE